MTWQRCSLVCSLVTFAILLVACSGSGSRPSENWTTGRVTYPQNREPALASNQVKITRQEFGDAWPFTVEEGILAFEQTGGPGIGAVTFAANGKTYGVNGIARGKRFGNADIDEIWADDPKHPGFKRDIGPVIKQGLQLAK